MGMGVFGGGPLSRVSSRSPPLRARSTCCAARGYAPIYGDGWVWGGSLIKGEQSLPSLEGAIDVLRPVVQSRGVAFIMNDRPELAVAHGCDGAHVGQEDMPVAEARRILKDLTLGVTCHASRELAFDAGEAGADYVAFGAFFPTSTKEAVSRAEVEILAWWHELMELPSVAIGGINAANCGPLVQAGADFLAVVGAVWGHNDGPAAGVKAMCGAIRQSSGR